MKRVFLIVLDSFGIGAMPDCEKFGDSFDCNTLKRISMIRAFQLRLRLNVRMMPVDGRSLPIKWQRIRKCAIMRRQEAAIRKKFLACG